MADLPLWQLLAIIIGSSGITHLVVPLLNAIWARLDKARETRSAKSAQHLSETNQQNAIQLEGLEFTQAGFIKLIERLEQEINSQRTKIADLRREVQECEDSREEVLHELRDVKEKLRVIEASLRDKQ